MDIHCLFGLHGLRKTMIDFEEALNYYKLAKEHKENTVYDNAIIRVLNKMN